MATSQQLKLSVQDYLDGEKLSSVKHEYVNGDVYAMTGASVNHNRLVSTVHGEFFSHLKGKPCEPFSSDMKVKVSDLEYRYPDVVVVCDDHFIDDTHATQTPVLIVEVLSKSTRRIDESDKRFSYMKIPTLQEYVIIEQDVVDIEVCRRSEGWISRHYFLGDEVPFNSIDLSLAVADIYARVQNEDMQEYLDKLAAEEGAFSDSEE